MTLPPPLPAPGYDRDAEHLRILSICWYIAAALQACVGLFALLYIGVGFMFAVGGAAAAAGHRGGGEEAAPALVAGGFFGCVGLFILALVAVSAFLQFKTGQALSRRRNITLIYVMAAIACIGFPVGTALGVFTFVVLARPSVRASFV